MSDIACSCWDINDNAAIWWVIKGPVLASIMVRIEHIPSQKTFDCKLLHYCIDSFRRAKIIIHHISCLFCPQINFILFIGIIIILVQKLQSPDIGGNESSIYLLVIYIYIYSTIFFIYSHF